MPARECSRTACSRPAVSTLTYVYADATAVLGPLARSSEPHTYDLCREHSAGLTVPRGWRAIRVPGAAEGSDDLVAIAEVLRSARRAEPEAGTGPVREARGAEARRDPEADGAPGGGASRTASNGRMLRAVRRPEGDDPGPAERPGHGGGRR